MIVSRVVLQQIQNLLPRVIQQDSWAAGNEGVGIPGTNGFRIEVCHGHLGYQETYEVINTGSSIRLTSTSLILLDHKPVWKMTFHGNCKRDVLPFLKRAFVRAYGERVFLEEGRPIDYLEEDSGLKYENLPFLGKFDRFHGRGHVLMVPVCGKATSHVVGQVHNFGGTLRR